MKRAFLLILSLAACSCSEKKEQNGLGTAPLGSTGPQEWVIDSTMQQRPNPQLPMAGVEPQANDPKLPPIRVEVLGRLEIEPRIGTPAREFLPRTVMKTGDARQFPLGTRNDGAIIGYQVGTPDKGKIPITITIEMWGTRRASSKWIASLAPGEARSFLTATSGANGTEILRFTLSYDALDPLPETKPGELIPKDYVPVQRKAPEP